MIKVRHKIHWTFSICLTTSFVVYKNKARVQKMNVSSQKRNKKENTYTHILMTLFALSLAIQSKWNWENPFLLSFWLYQQNILLSKKEKKVYRLLLVLCLHVYIENNIHQFILGLGGCQRAKVWSCFDQEFLVCSLGWKFIQLELLCVGRPLLSTYYCSLLRREKKQGVIFKMTTQHHFREITGLSLMFRH